MEFDNKSPNDQRRWLIFAALALPIWILGLVWAQHTQKLKAERLARQTPAAVTQDVAESPTPSSQIVAPDGGEAAGPVPIGEEPPAVARRPVTAGNVRLETDSVEVEFTTAGAVPTLWRLTDLRANNGRRKSDSSVSPADDGDTTGTVGVDLIDPALREYGLSLPFEVILKEQNAKFYHEFNRDTYAVTRSEQDGEQVLRFESPVTDAGAQLIKTYHFPKQGFQSSVDFEIVNHGNSRLSFNNQGQGLGVALGPGLGKAPETGSGFGGGHYEFTQPFYRKNDEIIGVKTHKGQEPTIFVDPSADITLAGIQDRYFMLGMVPGSTFPEGKGFTSGKATTDMSVMEVALANKDTIDFYPRLEVYGEPFTIEPGGSYKASFELFAGPKERSILKATGLGLERILFYNSWSWMRTLCFIMMSMLGFFHSMIGSWGLAIIALVVTVRLLTFPFAQIGMKHQANMMAQQARLKPHLDKLNEKYKDNPTKKNQEMMKLYREHNVNPFGMLKGCVWMFIQLPIFFALYRLLSQDFGLRGASFLWIADLSQADRLFRLGFALPLLGNYFNLLPILTAITQMLVSKLTTNPQASADPQQAAIQKQMMFMMPVMILVMTYQFPSGLCLYWMISNVWQVVQQRLVNRKVMHAPATVATT